MKRFLIILLTISITYSCKNTKSDTNSIVSNSEITDIETDKAEIMKVMRAQTIAWSNGDLEGFMNGYWNNENLKFYGSNGLTKGWQNTLDNYKRSYPTKAETGTLSFLINDISKIENGNYWVMGEYHLKRDVGDADGVFMIIFKRINGEWKIVADMSC